MPGITLHPCAVGLALKELQRCPINVCPDFFSTDHPMPATGGVAGQQKQNGRQDRSLGTVLSLNLVWTAMQLPVPAPLRMEHQAEALDQGLCLIHRSPARPRMFCMCCQIWGTHRKIQLMPISQNS